MKKPSEEFCDALFHAGTSDGTCELCKREHFNSEVINDETGYNNYEEWAEKAKNEPDKYVDHGDCSVGLGWVDRHQVIYDCPCNLLKKYEDFILNHEELILEFFKNRNRKIRKDLERKEKMLKEVADEEG